MYIPRHFQIHDAEMVAQIIDANSFGTLISTSPEGMQASHLPFNFDAERGVLRCHMARANPQWQSFDGQTEVLAIFQGAHGYISPRWYETKLAVPTWNYLAVHVYGVPQIIEDPDQITDLLQKLVTNHESEFETPWQLDAPADWQEKLQGAIVAFEIPLTRVQSKAKMSQNRPAADIAGVVSGLKTRRQTKLASLVDRFNPG